MTRNEPLKKPIGFITLISSLHVSVAVVLSSQILFNDALNMKHTNDKTSHPNSIEELDNQVDQVDSEIKNTG